MYCVDITYKVDAIQHYQILHETFAEFRRLMFTFEYSVFLQVIWY